MTKSDYIRDFTINLMDIINRHPGNYVGDKLMDPINLLIANFVLDLEIKYNNKEV